MKKRVRIYKAGGQTNEIDNNMENPEQQMQQGNPEAMQQQGQPQQGGQDQQMQQIMQFVQQMLQQGAQPADIAAQLLERQVPPEAIMQIFVQMGMQEAEAQQTIQAAMQNGQPQQQQGQGEEQMEGQASNPQEEQQEQQGPPPTQPGAQMSYGGGLQRRQPLFAEGGNVDQDELDTVVKDVEAMMSSDVDTDTIIQRITQQAQDGDISPEVAKMILDKLGEQKQASDPSGSDVAMQSQSNDPQAYTPEMGAPDQQMGYSKFGGNLKRLLTKAYGGSTAAPEERSKNYAEDRTNMFLDTIKNNTYKSILNGSFNRDGSVSAAYTSPTMSYGGGIPKAEGGINLKEGKVVIDPTQYKSEAEYKAAALDWNYANPENTVGMDLYKANPWKAPEVEKVDKATYTWDEASKSFKPAAAATTTANTGVAREGDILSRDSYGSYVTHKDGTMHRVPAGDNWENPPGAYTQQYGGYGQGNFNPVAYGRPGNTLFDNLYSGANPLGRFLANSGNRYSDLNVTGNNLPGGMSGEQFLGAAGQNGLFPGMAGKIGDQSWRIGEGEEFKEGSFWKGNRRKGTRYQVDWGNAAAMNPVGNVPGYTPTAAGPGYSGYNADANGDGLPDFLSRPNETTAPVATTNPAAVTTVDGVTPSSTDASVNPTTTAIVDPRQQIIDLEKQRNDLQEAVNMAKTNLSKQNPNADLNTQSVNSGTYPEDDYNALAGVTRAELENYNLERQRAASEGAINGYPVNQQGQAPLYSGEQPMMSATEQDVYQAPLDQGFTQNSNYDVYGNPTTTGVPAEYTPEADASTEVLMESDGPTNYKAPKKPIVKKKTVLSQTPVVKKQNNMATVTKPVEPVGNNSWGQAKGNNWYVPKNIDEAFDLKGQEKIDLFNQIDANWTSNERPTDEYRNNQLKKMQQRANTMRKNYMEQQAINKRNSANTNANLNSGLAYGGNVDPQALHNAIHLINRAYGGMIPRAGGGIDLGSIDTDVNKIPDYMQFENLPGNQPSIGANTGTLDTSVAKESTWDWNSFGDVYHDKFAPQTTNIMNKANAAPGLLANEIGRQSAINDTARSFESQSQGIYDQQGNWIPNNIGNQNLHQTNSNFAEQNQISKYGGNVFKYGGKVYEMGGVVDLTDDELAQLRAAGMNLTQVNG